MSLVNDLLPASFKGVPFYLSDSNVSGGRKDIKHSFPNSNKQAIEDLGLAPKVYNLVALISGDNYISNRDNLIKVLESGTPGTLSHPFYGEISNVKARTYTIKESMVDVGLAELSILFEVTDTTGIVRSIVTTPSVVNDKHTKVKESVSDSITNDWKVTPEYNGNFAASVTKVNEYTDSVTSVSNTVVKGKENLDVFNDSLNNLTDNVYAHVLDSDELAKSIIDLSDNLDSVYESQNDKFKVFKSFFNFGEGDREYTTYTAGILERESNNGIINNAVKVLSLSSAFNAAVNIDYLTVDELDAVTGILEAQYLELTNLPGYLYEKDNIKGLNTDVRDALDLMRQDANKLLTDIRDNINSVVNVRTHTLPARVIAYQYYGDSSNGEDIANINSVKDVSFMSGEIKVLS